MMNFNGNPKIHAPTAYLFFSMCLLSMTCRAVSGQDYKPGDPVTFGAAHKSPFDSSLPAGSPGSFKYNAPQNQGTINGAGASSPINMGAAQTTAPNPALNGLPDNFLNSRSIEWKPGDPVTLGSAHKPYAPPDNRLNNNNNNNNNNNGTTSPFPSSVAVPAPQVSTQSPNFPPSATPTLQDLMPNPATISNGSVGTPAVTPAVSTSVPFPSIAPSLSPAPSAMTAVNTPGFQTPNQSSRNLSRPVPVPVPAPAPKEKSKTHEHNQTEPKSNNPNSGNLFAHAFHWMGGLFGSNKQQ